MGTGPLLVLGGGISGLTAAYCLAREGREVVVLERGDRTGGLIDSEQVDGYRLEWGAHSVLGSADPVFDLLDELDASDSAVRAQPEARARYICRRGKLRRLVPAPGSFVTTRVLSWRAKARVLMEPLLRRRDVPDETVQAFFTRRFGREFADYVVGPFVSGVYAGLPAELELRSSFPRVHELEQQSGSVLRGGLRLLGGSASKRRGTYTFRDGMQSLTDALTARLTGSIRLGAEVRAVEPHESGWRVGYRQGGRDESVTSPGVISTLPAHCFADLIRPRSTAAADLLDTIPYAPLAVLQLGVRTDELARKLDGFGFLVPRQENLSILGSIWASAIFPHRAPADRQLITVFMGGRSRPEVADLPEETLRFRALSSLFQVFGGGFAPELVRVRRLSRAIPQYTVGHTARVARLGKAIAELPGLVLGGNYLDGVSIPRCIESGRRAAATLIDRVQPRATQRG